MYSIFVTIVIAIVYYLMNKVAWLDNLGRAKRSRADTQMENIIGHMSKLAFEQDTAADGKPRWHLAARANEAEVDE